MSIIQELKSIKSDKKELKKFGYTVGIVLALLGGLMLYKRNPDYLIMLIISGFLLLGATFIPAILLPFQKIWMGFAVIMGNIMSRVILALTFYIIITPISLISRIAGKDFLDRKLNPNAKTYWNYRDKKVKDPASYENQY